MFRVTMLPAAHGDCIWIEAGDEDAPRHILIDAGTTATYKKLKQAIRTRFGSERAHFDLFVITHIDADHIGGAVKLLEDLDVTYDDIWFNGWDHLMEEYVDDKLGAKQAELVTESIRHRQLPWNLAFNRRAVVADDWPTVVPLGDELRFTLLSPYRQQLHALVPSWKKELIKAGLVDDEGNLLEPSERGAALRDRLGEKEIDVETLLAAKFESDTAPANGSSIAFLLEYRDHAAKEIRAIFTGDAYPGVLIKSIERLAPAQRKVDLLKLSHHGSSGNTNNELLQLLDCPRYLVSTNGSQFHHPDPETIARIVSRKPKGAQLFFNYLSDETKPWKNALLRQEHGYKVTYPAGEEGGVVVEL